MISVLVVRGLYSVKRNKTHTKWKQTVSLDGPGGADSSWMGDHGGSMDLAGPRALTPAH